MAVSQSECKIAMMCDQQPIKSLQPIMEVCIFSVKGEDYNHKHYLTSDNLQGPIKFHYYYIIIPRSVIGPLTIIELKRRENVEMGQSNFTN